VQTLAQSRSVHASIPPALHAHVLQPSPAGQLEPRAQVSPFGSVHAPAPPSRGSDASP
jgi:hypothetical protein